MLLTLLSVSTLARYHESWAPHLFTAPYVYRQLQADQFALSADRKDEDLQFLSQDDLSALRDLADSHRAATAPAVSASQVAQRAWPFSLAASPVRLLGIMCDVRRKEA